MATRGTGSLGLGGGGVGVQRRGRLRGQHVINRQISQLTASSDRPTRKLRPKREQLCVRSHGTGLALPGPPLLVVTAPPGHWGDHGARPGGDPGAQGALLSRPRVLWQVSRKASPPPQPFLSQARVRQPAGSTLSATHRAPAAPPPTPPL